MKWIHCRRRQEVSLLAAAALGEEARIELEQHLSVCQECRSYYAEIKILTASLAAWEQNLSAIEATPAMRRRWAKAVQGTESSPERVPSLHCDTAKSLIFARIFQSRRNLQARVSTQSRKGAKTQSQETPHSQYLWQFFAPLRLRVFALNSFWFRLAAQLSLAAKSLCGVVWRELIRPNRHAWMGMAGLWVAMLAINAAISAHPTGGGESGAASSQAIIQAWEEQDRVLAELAQPAPVVPTPPPRFPGPRSQRTEEWVIL
jgi:hypothetical protein